ncbi:MAG: glutamate--tRNA ligase [Bacteroidota bacterium]
MARDFRVRFAPSPTGALHIGGIRTALYNYLLAKQKGGKFILRIEDTDQGRYVEGAEDYIVEALEWCGLKLDESPKLGGDFGPYRQSERKDIYKKYVDQLITSGNAYYAFDSSENLAAKRAAYEAEKKTFKYDASVRKEMDNSLSMSSTALQERLNSGESYTVRLKVPTDDRVIVEDEVRGNVSFNSNELDDKILLKADGMPTYHLANVVDDYLMKISHVIRGEEWLPSTAHHILLYRAFGWEDSIPQFAHLPLILKPNGKGKLSKRDGAKFGFPVFPLSWDGQSAEDSFEGFRSYGFLPEALVNFLAFLGWNPGTEQELFSLEELIAAFDVEKIGKSGARFDIEKGTWFNQQYLIHSDNKVLAGQIRPWVEAKDYQASDEYLAGVCALMKERVSLLKDFPEVGYYFFEAVKAYEGKPVRKNWKPEYRAAFDELLTVIDSVEGFTAETLESTVKEFITQQELRIGTVFQILRVGVSGTLKGPSVFDMIALLGKEETLERMKKAYVKFDEMKALGFKS